MVVGAANGGRACSYPWGYRLTTLCNTQPCRICTVAVSLQSSFQTLRVRFRFFSPIIAARNSSVPLLRVDCVGSFEFADDATCSKSCGGGSIISAFNIASPAANGGLPCPFSVSATRSMQCNTGPCAVQSGVCVLYTLLRFLSPFCSLPTLTKFLVEMSACFLAVSSQPSSPSRTLWLVIAPAIAVGGALVMVAAGVAVYFAKCRGSARGGHQVQIADDRRPSFADVGQGCLCFFLASVQCHVSDCPSQRLPAVPNDIGWCFCFVYVGDISVFRRHCGRRFCRRKCCRIVC